MKEELKGRLFHDDTPVFYNPDWNKITSIIAAKYPKVDAKEVILNYQIFYYSMLKDCSKWAIAQDQKIKSYLSKPMWPQLYSELNDLGALEAFLSCVDEKVLLGDLNGLT